MRQLVGAACACFLVMVGSIGVARAGGSWFYQVEPVDPGGTVTMVGHSGFGDLEAGPYYGYLQLSEDQAPQSYPGIDSMYRVGELTITNNETYGWDRYRLHLTFEVPPDLAPGYYRFRHCNEPCTTTFGELIEGAVAVGDVSGLDVELPAPAEIVGFDDPRAGGLSIDEVQTLAFTGSDALVASIGIALVTVGAAILVVARRNDEPPSANATSVRP